MKNVGIVYHKLYAKHNTGNHPECADRVLKTIDRLEENNMYGEDSDSHYLEIQPYMATVEQITKIHSRNLVDSVKKMSRTLKGKGSITHIDGDTLVSEYTYDASLMAVGGNFAAIESIMSNQIERGFVLCRPPGHHANNRKASGFCVFNNIALDVNYLLNEKGLDKVAIVDFDVHAGNGTEAIFQEGPKRGELLMFSLHQHPYTLYPGTCFVGDVGIGDQEGKICNLTMYPSSTANSVKACFQKVVLPMLNEYKPEFILISAGFDAHHSDPLAGLQYDYGLYHWMTNELGVIADKYAKGRMLATLEGGYNLDAISKSITNVVASMRGEKSVYEEAPKEHKKSFTQTEEKLLPKVKEIFGNYWECI